MEEDETTDLEDTKYPYNTTIATDIHETNVEIVALNEVTHIQNERLDDKVAVMKFDTTYPLINDAPLTEEKEVILEIKDKSKIIIKPTFNSFEPLEITEIETDNNVVDFQVSPTAVKNTASKSVIPIDNLVTSEILSNMSLAELIPDKSQLEIAKSSVLLKEAINISESLSSQEEVPLSETQRVEFNASVGFAPHHGINVIEIRDQHHEEELNEQFDKKAQGKLKFNLHESLLVGEVFIEDKSGKYYPELIVPTETAHKDILVSNQILTELHDVQEKEGTLQGLKYPPVQEASVDITSKDSLIVSVDETHEKEGELIIKEKPSECVIDKDVLLHTSLSNIITTSHIKESEFSPGELNVKQANVGINEHQHKFNIETNIHDSEIDLEEDKPTGTSQAQIIISALDKNTMEEVYINESEKELIVKDDKLIAIANMDINVTQSVITSEITEMSSLNKMKDFDRLTDDIAVETFITTDANIVTAPMIHEQELSTEYLSKETEIVTESIIPNLSLSVTEADLTESEDKLTQKKIPEAITAKLAPTHPLKISVSELVTTADQIDFLKSQQNITEMASEHRDLHKEITVLQTTVHEHLDKLSEGQNLEKTATPSYINKESLSVTEVITSLTEDKLDEEKRKATVVANVDIDTDRKIAITAEVNTRDSLNQLNVDAPKFEEAQRSSDLLTSIQVLENEALDTQSLLHSDIKPETKNILPEIIPSTESVNVTQILEHEKEQEYEGKFVPETFKATSDISGRTVAISSELVVDSSVAYTEKANITKMLQKANIDNTAFKELTITTTDSNEKEQILNIIHHPNTVSAAVCIDTTQSIFVEEMKSELLPTAFEKLSDMTCAHAKLSTVAKEAIINEETLIHLSEGVLQEKSVEENVTPLISISALQVPQYDEKLIVEREQSLINQTTPEIHIADLSITQRHSLQVTETLSHSDNLEKAKNISLDFKSANIKMDDVYGKSPNVEEVIINEVTHDFAKSIPIEEKSNIISVPSFTVEQTEIIMAESEQSMPSQKTVQSTASSEYTEKQALITSSVETVENERNLEIKKQLPSQDVLIGIVPFSGTINTEILTSSNVEELSQTLPITSTALMIQNDLQKHITGLQYLSGEKETELTLPKTITSKIEPKQVFSEIPTKEITEILTMENEGILESILETRHMMAKQSISEHQSLMNSEVLVNYESEDLHVPGSKIITALKTHGIQEAVQNIETILGEKESIFDKKQELPIENTKYKVESQKYIDNLEVVTTEKEKEFKTNENIPEGKLIQPSINIKLQSSLGVNEIVVNEDENDLSMSSSFKPEKAGLNIQSRDYLNVSIETIIEKEQLLQTDNLPKKIISESSIKPHEYLNIEEHNILELEESIYGLQVKNMVGKVLVESLNPLNISEIQTPEYFEEFVTQSEKANHPLVGLEIGGYLNVQEAQVLEGSNEFDVKQYHKTEQGVFTIEPVKHITVTSTETRESETPIEKSKTENLKISEINFEYQYPLNIEEVSLKESENNLPNLIKPREEKPNVAIESQQYITVTDVETREKESEIIIKEHHGQEQNHRVDIEPKHHIMVSETMFTEGETEFTGSIRIKNEIAHQIQTTHQELENIVPHILDTVESLNKVFEPLKSSAEYDIEGLKSYITTENVTEEIHGKIDHDKNEIRIAEERLEEMKYFEQTEIVTEEKAKTLAKIDEVKDEKAQETQSTTQAIYNIQPQVVESVKDFLNFEPEKSHIHCDIQLHKSYITSENVPQEHSEDILPYTAQSKETTLTTTEISPLIISEDVSLHREDNLFVTEPKKQSITKSLTIAKEIEVLEEFIDEQLVPFRDTTPKQITCKTSKLEQENTYTSSKQETLISGKLQFILF